MNTYIVNRKKCDRKRSRGIICNEKGAVLTLTLMPLFWFVFGHRIKVCNKSMLLMSTNQ